MGVGEQDRVAGARKSSAAWQLGLTGRPYVWRRDDPDREEKIAAEKAESERKQAWGLAGAKARLAVSEAN